MEARNPDPFVPHQKIFNPVQVLIVYSCILS
jgi:hypothetical protein